MCLQISLFEKRRRRFWMLLLGGLLGLEQGCQTTGRSTDFEPVVAQFYIETAPADPSASLATLPTSGVQIPVLPRVVFSEGDIADVELVRVELGLCLMFELTSDAVQSLYRVTASNLGRRLVVALNGRPFGARVIDAPMQDGRLFIFVELPDEELAATAVNLKKTAANIQEAVRKSKG